MRVSKEHEIRIQAFDLGQRNPFCRVCGDYRARFAPAMACPGCLRWASDTAARLRRRRFVLVRAS